jgi:hypothetical protein
VIDPPAHDRHVLMSKRQSQWQQPRIDARVAGRQQGREHRASIERKAAPDPFNRIVDRRSPRSGPIMLRANVRGCRREDDVFVGIAENERQQRFDGQAPVADAIAGLVGMVPALVHRTRWQAMPVVDQDRRYRAHGQTSRPSQGRCRPDRGVQRAARVPGGRQKRKTLRATIRAPEGSESFHPLRCLPAASAPRGARHLAREGRLAGA